MLIIKKRLKCSHCVRMMHKRIQPLKITAAMKDFFFFQKLNSDWEYIKNKKKEILRVKKKNNAKQLVKTSQLCGMEALSTLQTKAPF